MKAVKEKRWELITQLGYIIAYIVICFALHYDWFRMQELLRKPLYVWMLADFTLYCIRFLFLVHVFIKKEVRGSADACIYFLQLILGFWACWVLSMAYKSQGG